MTRSESISRWFWDQPSYQWKVKLTDGTTIKVGDHVQVRLEGSGSSWPSLLVGRVKQVAGFGTKETRPVISILFPGRSKGVKIDIDKVIKKS